MKSKTTKRALLSSCVALMLCFSMLLGTTYAWFTDEVTSNENIIQSGTLDATMEWADTYDGNYKDAAAGAIFGYKNWEPGYTDVKYVKIGNVGSLAFRYQLNIIPKMSVAEGEADLADVIDVYFGIVDSGFASRDAAVAGLRKVGTLADLMTDPDGAAYGYLLPAANMGPVDTSNLDQNLIQQENFTACIALKMQETAGNEYQNLSVGEGFSVQLLATQLTYEKDSFDNIYDEDAGFDAAPVAKVIPLKADALTIDVHQENEPLVLDVGYQMVPTKESAEDSLYKDWHADFVVTADKLVPANSMKLAGYYEAFCSLINNKWVAMDAGVDIAANTEVRLVKELGVTVSYEEVCQYGNDGTGFKCGAVDLTGVNAGTTMTVQLRLYETDEALGALSTFDSETGEYIVIGEYTYTFGVNNSKKLVDAIAAGGIVTLSEDLALEDQPITVPAGVETVLDLNGYTLSGVATNAGTSNLIKVESGAKLTLTGDGTITFGATTPDTNWGGEGQPAFPGYANNTISNRGTLIVDGVTIENKTAAGGASYVIDNYDGGNLTINSGYLNGYGKVAIRMFAGSPTNANNVTIKGGTIEGSRAVWVQLAGSDSSKAPDANLTVTGGTLTSTEYEYNLAIYSYSYGNSFADTDISISGGTFNGNVHFGGGHKGDIENVSITGGTFNGEVGRWISTEEFQTIPV